MKSSVEELFYYFYPYLIFFNGFYFLDLNMPAIDTPVQTIVVTVKAYMLYKQMSTTFSKVLSSNRPSPVRTGASLANIKDKTTTTAVNMKVGAIQLLRLSPFSLTLLFLAPRIMAKAKTIKVQSAVSTYIQITSRPVKRGAVSVFPLNVS